MASSKVVRCAFCGLDLSATLRLIKGPAAYICDKCVVLCQEIIFESDIPTGCSQAEIIEAEKSGSLTAGWLMQQMEAANDDARLEAFLAMSVSDLNVFMHAQIRRALDERLPEEIAALEVEVTRQKDALQAVQKQEKEAQETLENTTEELSLKRRRLASISKDN